MMISCPSRGMSWDFRVSRDWMLGGRSFAGVLDLPGNAPHVCNRERGRRAIQLCPNRSDYPSARRASQALCLRIIRIWRDGGAESVVGALIVLHVGGRHSQEEVTQCKVEQALQPIQRGRRGDIVIAPMQGHARHADVCMRIVAVEGHRFRVGFTGIVPLAPILTYRAAV
jgi:hypothetical protein